MKIAAILLMLFGVFLILGLGFMSLLGLAMSFDAPGSESDSVAWMNRILIFVLPLIVLTLVLFFAWISFRKGHYTRSFWIGSIFALVLIGFVLLTTIFSFISVNKFQNITKNDAENERLYPLQKFLRPVDGGVDTILVFPGRTVAYRLYTGEAYPFAGPVGELNETRDTIIIDFDQDTRLIKEELSQFVNTEGRRLTDIYGVK
ncbi:MAG TPA: hypothetical protein VFG10_07485 [Saprospiraceae bacterium]|nr:hypothetical protein [Saprospiraceae bacterium]